MTAVRTKLLLALACLGLAASAASQEAGDPLLQALLKEATANNPDLRAAQRELDAARSRVAPAEALDDPMLEAGLLNVPTSLSLNKEDMTMKMIGVTQRLPYPGKRGLRREMAEREAASVGHNLREAGNRVRRDVKVAYFDLALVHESQRLAQKNLRVLETLSSIAESRYAVGQTSQADVLKAQTQRARMQEELIKLGRERPTLEAELNRALGRSGAAAPVEPAPLRLPEATLDADELRIMARDSRPQLLAQQNLVQRNLKALELARKDYYPDFDVRFSYGQRDNLEAMKREDMISLTVAINLPLWRKDKREPRVAEAEAMREQASSMYQARANETEAMLRQQIAAAEQALRAVRLYETALLPHARLAADASLAAYRVGRVDFFTLLDSQMTVFNAEVGYAASLASRSKALTELELLTGRDLF